MASQIIKPVMLQNYNKNTNRNTYSFYIYMIYVLQELLKVKFPAVSTMAVPQRCLKAVIHVLKCFDRSLLNVPID